MLWRLFYNGLVIPVGWLGFRLLGVFDKKAARGIRGRQDLFTRLERQVGALDPKGKRIWFHSSSMGEFEQAKPIIAELKRRRPDLQIIVSFFSPSGYEHSQAYKLASVITYIPFDSAANARRFISLVRPDAAVIVRYDVWPNHVWELHRRRIPVFIANATLRRTTSRALPFLKQFHRALYNSIDYILTVSGEDKEVFESFALSHPVVSSIGDTRFDQVWRRSAESRTRRLLDAKILERKKVLVIGSSWREDEEVLLPACRSVFETHPCFLVILVPHEPTEENLERIETALNGTTASIRFSNLHEYGGEKIILIDSIGILMGLYQYADAAFVGGSFRGGVHNVLEPAAYGIPVLFGPRHTNSREAMDMVAERAGISGGDTWTVANELRRLLDDEMLRKATGERALAMVRRNTGATDRFLSYLEKVL